MNPAGESPGRHPLQDFLPSAEQVRLFRFALAEGDRDSLNEAVAGGEEGTPYLPELLQHLPLLQRKILPAEEGLLADAVRAAHRQTWAANQMLFAAVRSCLQTLHDAGVRTLLLKGAALLAAFYDDMGARSMGDFDVLVPAENFKTAVRALTASGWRPVHPEEGFDERFLHAFAMVDARGNNLDLHAHALHFTLAPDADDLFWNAAVPLLTRGLQTLRLCDADQCVHLAVHGFRWSPQPQVRWVPDLATVLRSGAVDWDRLVTMATHLHATISVSAALDYVSEQGLAAVPERVLTKLRATATMPVERSLFELSTRDNFSDLGNTLRFHWHIMTQSRAGQGTLQKLRLLPAYFSHRMKTRDFQSRSGLIRDGLFRHFLAKFGRYDESSEGQRLR